MKNILFTVPSKVASAEWIPFLQLLKEKNYKHSLEYSDRFLVLNESDLNWETLDKIGSKLNNDIEKLSLHQFLKLAMNTGSLFNVSSPLGYVTLMDSVHKFIWDQFPEKEIQKFLSIKGTKFIGEETATGDFIISTNPQALPISRAPNIIELKPKNMILPRMKEQKWDWNQSLIIENDTQGEIQQINDITIQVLNRSFRTFDLKLSSKSGVNFPVWVHWNETFSRYLQFEQEGKPLESRKANFWSTAFRIQPIHKESYIIVTAKYQNPLIPLGQSLFYIWVGLGIILCRLDRRKSTNK
ncbi:MAG: hypothetical protein M9962_09580 [Oligoflexia bacterium]|nr:hypothetical protein [Oligoflexia bacterium]